MVAHLIYSCALAFFAIVPKPSSVMAGKINSAMFSSNATKKLRVRFSFSMEQAYVESYAAP